MARKAIAYVSDVILGRSGEVVSRQSQRERILEHARASDIEIVAWFEDSAYAERLPQRTGIRALLACQAGCDCLLFERVWCLTRSLGELRAFLDELDGLKLRLEATTLLWDCVSQMARHHYARPATPVRKLAPVAAPARTPARVEQPSQLHFVNLKRAPGCA